MKNIYIKFVNFSFVILAIFIYGCGSDPVTPPAVTKITVNGKFLDIFGNPASGKNVMIGTQTTTTDNNGSFTINNVTTPYDAYFLASASQVFVFKGLSIANPQLPGSISGVLPPNLTVQIPMVPNGSKAMVLYEDTVTGYISGSAIISPGSNHASINLGGINGQPTAGKIYVLQYNIDANDVITSYTNYGAKSFIMIIGSNPTVAFTWQQLSIIPGTSMISGSVNVPQGYNTNGTGFYVNFGTKNNRGNSGGNVQFISGNTFIYNVPTGLPDPVFLNVQASLTGVFSERMITVNAGTSNAVINLDAPTMLTNPVMGEINVDTNTIFTYTPGTANGIHIVLLNGGGKNFVIFTSNITAKMPNLAAYPIGSNIHYDWQVFKFMDFNNINDFCSQHFLLNPAFKSITISSLSSFTTKP